MLTLKSIINIITQYACESDDVDIKKYSCFGGYVKSPSCDSHTKNSEICKLCKHIKKRIDNNKRKKFLLMVLAQNKYIKA